MNKTDLLKIVAKKTSLNKQDISLAIDTMLTTILDELAANEKVSIRGFGVFQPVFYDTRPVRNPRTGEAMMLIPRKSIRLKVGDDVVRKLNK